MKGSLDVSNAISDGLQILGTLRADNTITQAETASIAGYLASITKLNQTFRSDVKTIKASGATGKAAYLSAASTFVANASDPAILAAVHVSNPASQTRVQTIVEGIKTALTAVQTAINAAKG